MESVLCWWNYSWGWSLPWNVTKTFMWIENKNMFSWKKYYFNITEISNIDSLYSSVSFTVKSFYYSTFEIYNIITTFLFSLFSLQTLPYNPLFSHSNFIASFFICFYCMQICISTCIYICNYTLIFLKKSSNSVMLLICMYVVRMAILYWIIN